MLRFAEVTQKTKADFAALFGAKGAPSYCWCTAWRDLPDRSASNAVKKKIMMKRIADRVPIGLLAYEGKEPVGWCSVAPRNTLRKLSPDQDDTENGIWSVVCFFILREHRGKGLAPKLLDAAVKLAFKKGAKAVEAYPVDEDSPSYRFMGFRPMFRDKGFRQTGKAGSRRHVMRLAK